MAETPVKGFYQSSETDTKRQTITETAATMQKIEDEFLQVENKIKAANSNFLVNNFGSNYSVGNDTWSPAESTIDNEVNELALVGPRPILLDFHIRRDAGGVLRIVQYGFNSLTHSESKVDYAVAKLKEKGFTIHGIKVHPTGSSTGSYVFDEQYLTVYRALVNQLATKYQGQVPVFLVTNEFPEVTGSDALKSSLQAIITDVKAKGYSVGISMINVNELINLKVTGDLDCYGINSYPYVGTKGLSTTPDEVVAAWKRSGYLEAFADLKKKYPNKQTFITETGTTDKIISLEYPAYWNVAANPDNNGSIMKIFWEGTFKLMKDIGYIDMIFGWDAGIYSPYKFQTSLDTMKKWVGESV